MRSYDVAVASLAIGAPPKWTDNTISQHAVADIVSARRGVARRIPHHVLLRLALTRQLHCELGLGVSDALHLAAKLLDSEGDGVHQSGHLRLALDLPAFEHALNVRLHDALESAPAPRRGRPARRTPM